MVDRDRAAGGRGMPAAELAVATAAGLVATLAIVALAGWAFGVRGLVSFVSGGATMKVNTAIAFLATAAGLWVQARATSSTSAAALALAFVPLLIGVTTLLSYATGRDLGIDELLLRDPWTPRDALPGRMSPATAASFIAAGMALVLSRTKRFLPGVQACIALLFAVSWFSLLSIAYGLRSLEGIPGFHTLSIPTAIAFLAVAVGAASLHPETGVMSLLASPGAAGASARFLLPTGAFLPIVVGWIRIRAGALGFFGVESGTAFFATFTALGLVALSWRNARGLQRLDLVREEADARIHEELERTRAALELARGYLESAPGAMLVADADGLVAVANSEAERLFRTRRAALLGQRLDALLPEHLSDASYGRRTIARTAGPRSVEVETSFRPLATREGVLTIVGLRDITAQRRAEAELVASERRFRGIFDSTLHFIGLMSPDGTLLEVNRAALEFGGVSREEVIDKPLWEARPWTHDPEVQVRLRDAVRRAAAGELVSFETRVLGADDRLAIVAFSLKPLRDEDGEVVLLVPEAQDVTEARGAEERLRASLAEKETLLKEVHHRVKNNLQVISSLLKLHAGRVADPDARAAFEEAQGRVRSIALLHEKLYRSESLGSVSIGDYAEDLASALLRARGADGRPVRISVSGGDVHLPVDRAMPCGLILNELVTNSLKHGFPAAIAEPEVAIRARRVGCEIEITVTDNGVGLPEDFDPRGTRTLGIQLVRTLTRQLGGSIAFERHAGTRCVLQFPARDQTAEAS